MLNDETISAIETANHVREVGCNLSRIISELVQRAVWHDTSKLNSPEEVGPFLSVTPKLKGLTYGSEEYNRSLAEIQPAIRHHYRHNSHHPEYHQNGIKDMTLVDIVEMVCDWKAAASRHADGDIFKSIEINQKRFGYSDELKQIMINTVNDLLRREN